MHVWAFAVENVVSLFCRLLVVLPKVSTVRKLKEELCSVLNGAALDPDSVIVALVKENHIDHILVSLSLACGKRNY